MRKIGIEHEFFILKDGLPPSIQDINNLMLKLKSQGFYNFNEKEDPLKVSKEVESGYIAVNNDFCTHILEIAFPPQSNIEKLFQILNEHYELIKKSLNELGMTIQPGGLIELSPEQIIFLPHKKLEWMKQRVVPNKSYSHRFLTSKICATQIHIETFKIDTLMQRLDDLYSIEILTPLFYTNSKTNNAHCVRPLMWRDSFPDEYVFNGFLSEQFNSYQAYHNRFLEIPDCKRDYSLIAPRTNTRIEFRGGCSQPNIESLIELAIFKFLTVELIENNLVIFFNKVNKNDYYHTCRFGEVKKFDFTILSHSIHRWMENNYNKFNFIYINRILKRLENG